VHQRLRKIRGFSNCGTANHDEQKDIHVKLEENLVIDVTDQSEFVFSSLTGVLDTEIETGGVRCLANMY
jgi:hypothetical protein